MDAEGLVARVSRRVVVGHQVITITKLRLFI